MPLYKKAFTLAETLITLTILGIVAVIVVPNLINKQVENANRTKVKKVISAYEKAINMMAIKNNFKTTQALKSFGEEETCKYTREYFKSIQDGANNCIFKTADNVWWDITDITNPIISLKDEITDSNKAEIRANALNYEADKVSFALIGRYDDNGALRIDDNGFEQSQENNDNYKNYMTKLWSFIDNTVPSENPQVNPQENPQGNPQVNPQEEEVPPPVETRQVCNSVNCCISLYSGQKCAEVTIPLVKYIDESGRTTNSGSGCTSETECASWNNSIYEDLGDGNELVYIGWACSGTNLESCPEPQNGNVYTFKMNGEIKADITCSNTSCTCAGYRWPDLACTPENIKKMNTSMQKQGLPYQIQQ